MQQSRVVRPVGADDDAWYRLVRGRPTTAQLGRRTSQAELLAIVSKSAYSGCMFENLMDPKEVRTALTDAGHTAAGFAALAAKKATEVRSDLAVRYEAQLAESRKIALDVVTRLEGARSAFDAKVEPVVAKVTDRLPEPAQKVIADVTEARKSFQAKAHEFVVKAITVEIPTMKAPAAKSSTKASTAKANTAKTSTAKSTALKARKMVSKAATKSVAKAKATTAKATRTPRATTAKATRTPRAAKATAAA